MPKRRRLAAICFGAVVTLLAACAPMQEVDLPRPGAAFATRDPAAAGISDLEGMIELGASPRASIYLTRTAKAHAFLQGRDYATPHDVKTIAHDVLRHRVILTYEAEAEGKTSEDIIDRILTGVLVP